MRFTKRDYDEHSESETRLEAFLKVVARCLRPLARIGFVKRFIGGTLGGRFGAIGRYQRRGEYDKAADLAVELLTEYRHQAPGTLTVTGADFWWQFMRAAVRSLDKLEDQERRERVIKLARNGPEPFEGYDVAYAFLGFARWRYQQKNFDAAIEFATTASRADPTWPEPDFFLGWLCLAKGRGDALAHLSLAVDKDPRILERIVEDPLCRQHPHLIEGLRKISSDTPIVPSGRPDKED